MSPERSHLDRLESEAVFILREVAGECARPALLFSGGKDSLVLLRLAAVKHVVDLHAPEPRTGRSSLEMNDIARVALELAQPVFADAYAEERATGAFILIDAASRHTVAAGMIR